MRQRFIAEQSKTPGSNRKNISNNCCSSLIKEVKVVEFFLDINHQKQEGDCLNTVIKGKLYIFITVAKTDHQRIIQLLQTTPYFSIDKSIFCLHLQVEN